MSVRTATTVLAEEREISARRLARGTGGTVRQLRSSSAHADAQLWRTAAGPGSGAARRGLPPWRSSLRDDGGGLRFAGQPQPEDVVTCPVAIVVTVAATPITQIEAQLCMYVGSKGRSAAMAGPCRSRPGGIFRTGWCVICPGRSGRLPEHDAHPRRSGCATSIDAVLAATALGSYPIVRWAIGWGTR